MDRGVWHLVTGLPYPIRLAGYGLRAPKNPVPGMDLAGIVEEVGAGVTRFAPGDAVFGIGRGTFAEYARAPESKLAARPVNLSAEQAAVVAVSGLPALQGLRDHGRVGAGQRVLVVGASGGVGTYAVQIAKALGAEVTGVCSTRNLEMVRSLGADHVVDYTKENFTKRNERYDIILDNVGSQDFTDMADVMKPDGIIVVVGGSKKGPFLGPIKRILWSKIVRIDPKITFYLARVNKADLELLANLAREGKLKSVIDRRYPLEQTGAALAYLGEGHARGKVVVTVN
jgi:NADPH:quinone reductase-like Zn-dependent oxidoreductase